MQALSQIDNARFQRLSPSHAKLRLQRAARGGCDI